MSFHNTPWSTPTPTDPIRIIGTKFFTGPVEFGPGMGSSCDNYKQLLNICRNERTGREVDCATAGIPRRVKDSIIEYANGGSCQWKIVDDPNSCDCKTDTMPSIVSCPGTYKRDERACASKAPKPRSSNTPCRTNVRDDKCIGDGLVVNYSAPRPLPYMTPSGPILSCDTFQRKSYVCKDQWGKIRKNCNVPVPAPTEELFSSENCRWVDIPLRPNDYNANRACTGNCARNYPSGYCPARDRRSACGGTQLTYPCSYFNSCK